MCNASFIGMGAQGGQMLVASQAGAASAESNANIADQQRRDALVRGNAAVDKQRNETKGFMGDQRAAMGASGFQVDSGSSGDVLAQTAVMGEADAQTLRANSLKEAWGYEVQRDQYKSQAESQSTMSSFLSAGLSNKSGRSSGLLTGGIGNAVYVTGRMFK